MYWQKSRLYKYYKSELKSQLQSNEQILQNDTTEHLSTKNTGKE